MEIDKMQVVENAIDQREVIEFLVNKDLKKMYPHEILYFDGGLSLIGENIDTKCMEHEFIEDVRIISSHKDNFEAHFGHVQVAEYIRENWKMNESEVRLILKILDNNIDLYPRFYYFVNPFITTNEENELIWAGTCERSGQIRSWLDSLSGKVEIIGEIIPE